MDGDGDRALRRPPFGKSSGIGQRGAVTQRRILNAALAVFGERGFHDTRVEVITEVAGCSRPAFYQYFAGKEDVFWHLASRLARSMGDLADQLDDIAPDQAGLRHLGDWLDELVDLHASYAPIFSAFQAAIREEVPLAEGSRSISERFGRAIVGNVDDRPAELPVEALASATVTGLLRSLHYRRVGLGQLPRARLVDGLAQTLHRLLHGPIADVNTTAVRDPPSQQLPPWPTLPDPDERGEPPRSRGRIARRKLIDAGASVLPTRGYHATRIEDLVKAAGVSHGSFYRYFDNKDELFALIAAEAAARLVGLITAFPDAVDDASLHRWLTDWFDAYQNNGAVISAWQEIDYGEPELEAFSVEVALVMFDRLRRIIARRGFGDSTVDALMLLGVMERVPYSVEVLGYLDAADAINASAFIIERGLLGTTSGQT